MPDFSGQDTEAAVDELKLTMDLHAECLAMELAEAFDQHALSVLRPLYDALDARRAAVLRAQENYHDDLHAQAMEDTSTYLTQKAGGMDANRAEDIQIAGFLASHAVHQKQTALVEHAKAVLEIENRAVKGMVDDLVPMIRRTEGLILDEELITKMQEAKEHAFFREVFGGALFPQVLKLSAV